MKTPCHNCGEMFEDRRANALVNLVASGITDTNILKDTLSSDPFCPECSDEAARLNHIVKSMITAASYQANRELSIFGEKRRDRRQSRNE